MKLTAQVERSGKWWVVTVPEIPGLFTQVKHLSEVEEMVCDAARVLRPDLVEPLNIKVELASPAPLVKNALDLRREQQLVTSRAQAANILAVQRLKQDGLTVRDIAKVLDCSAQTVSNLSKMSTTASAPAL
jgi:predicted RNase H-like HicB family nuclease